MWHWSEVTFAIVVRGVDLVRSTYALPKVMATTLPICASSCRLRDDLSHMRHSRMSWLYSMLIRMDCHTWRCSVLMSRYFYVGR